MATDPEGPGDRPAWQEEIFAWPRASGRVDALAAAVAAREQLVRARRRRRLAGSAAIAAVCIAAAGVGLFPVHLPFAPSPPAAATATLTAPERRVLPDGTVVELKPGAEIAVEFSHGDAAGPRRVALVRGTALFAVAKNPARPFLVRAGDVQFRAVGTEFAVGRSEVGVELLVTEGRVAVEIDAPKAAPLLLDAGERVVVGAEPPAVETASPAEIGAALAWRVPRLEFFETPLREVARLLALHGGHRIEPGDRLMGNVAINGTLRADNLDPLLEVLASTYGIVAERSSDGVVRLRSGR